MLSIKKKIDLPKITDFSKNRKSDKFKKNQDRSFLINFDYKIDFLLVFKSILPQID